jgi:hypothetical protein
LKVEIGDFSAINWYKMDMMPEEEPRFFLAEVLIFFEKLSQAIRCPHYHPDFPRLKT